MRMSLLAATNPQKKNTETSVANAPLLDCVISLKYAMTLAIVSRLMAFINKMLLLLLPACGASFIFAAMKAPDLKLLTPEHFDDYELIDCGNFEKLERFGKYVTIRPEPQALWTPVKSPKEWERMAHVRFEPKNSSSGEW